MHHEIMFNDRTMAFYINFRIYIIYIEEDFFNIVEYTNRKFNYAGKNYERAYIYNSFEEKRDFLCAL